jgi:competence protein ComEA
MKTLHLLLAVVITLSLGVSLFAGDVFAAAEKKEVTAPAEKAAAPQKAVADEQKTAAKAVKGLPKDVNINTADKETLVLLPGIGPVAAEAILAYRKDNGNFKSIDELTKVKGIGDKTLEKLKPFLQVI